MKPINKNKVIKKYQDRPFSLNLNHKEVSLLKKYGYTLVNETFNTMILTDSLGNKTTGGYTCNIIVPKLLEKLTLQEANDLSYEDICKIHSYTLVDYNPLTLISPSGQIVEGEFAEIFIEHLRHRKPM